MASILITGGTGYIGRAAIPELLRRGHEVRALVRFGSERKLAAGAEAVAGNPLDAGSVEAAIGASDTLIHLVGVPHPSPAKAQQFREIDLASIRATVRASMNAGLRHLVYVSVAHPAPVMKAYIEVRMQGEAMIREAGLNATILRPWYVLGPGHRWPYALIPVYWLMEQIPATRGAARRLGLSTLSHVVNALADAADRPASGVRVIMAPEMRPAAAAIY
jgi:uncharacterized protein YbjT (DUF2867 family)